MNIEKKRIEAGTTGKGDSIGYIKLDKLAIPETVKVTLLGEPIIPKSFDIFGHPIFTHEQVMLYMFKEEELKRQNGGKYTPLEAVIAYEERFFDVPRSTFDTIRGIKKSLSSLSDLNEMLRNRRLFCKAHKNEMLNEYMLFGCFHLDQFGNQEMSLRQTAKNRLGMKNDVEDFETFCRHSEGFTLSSDGYQIPNAGSVCPCCGKEFTIEDLKNNPIVLRDRKYYHNSCWRNYQRLTEVDYFTRKIVGLLYKDTDYQFELLPNGYCNCDCCSHIPWFLFHTIDGDIIMGWWENSVISIEWQENYKPFDMNELFSTEKVTKWEKDGKRGIYALSEGKVFEYLKKVLEAINPSYSKDNS